MVKYRIIKSCELYHHGILGQKWGVRRYQNLDGSLTKAGKSRYSSETLADNIFNKSKKLEPKITKDVLDSVDNTSAQMYGLENRLKTFESINRKIKTDSIEKNISIFASSKDIKDAIRYTAISNDKDFVKNYNKIKQSLIQKGYKEIRCKNYFDLYDKGLVKHKSVQSIFEDKDHNLFELQFQTPSSQKAKDDKIPLYEERRKPGLSKEKQQELEKKMVLLAEKVPNPINIYTIKSH